MENDGKTLLIKCNNPKGHDYPNREKGEGNVLFFLRGNSIFIKCTGCKRFTRTVITQPGTFINFSKASYIQKIMPKDYHFDADQAISIIEEST